MPQGPFSLAAAQDFAGGFPAGIGGGDASAADPSASSAGSRLVMAFPVEGWHGSAAVELSQPRDDAPVEGRVAGEEAVQAQGQALRSVSLDHDGRGWAEVGRRDPVIGRLQVAHRFLRPVCFYSAYEAATSFVIGQRIARRQGARIKAWLGEQAGDRIELDGRTFVAFPGLSVSSRSATYRGLPVEKIARLHGLAQAALDGRLDTERLRSLPTADALAELRELRGVGPFTAEGILLRGCGVADEVPGEDPLTRAAVTDLYELPKPLTDAGFHELTERWRPYRMWAIVLLRVGWARANPNASYRRESGPRS